MINEGNPPVAFEGPVSGFDNSMSIHHQEQMVDDHRLLQRETEVFQNMKGALEFIRGPVISNVLRNPSAVHYVVVVAESGTGKGPAIAGAADELMNNTSLKEGLERYGKELALRYTSTAICARYAEEHDFVRKGYWGQYEPEELRRIFTVEKYGTLLASARLADQDPKKTNIVLVEAVDIADELLMLLAQNRNAFFIMVDTDPEVQKNSAEAREIIWSPVLTDKQKKKALAERGIVYDTEDSERMKYSMGNRAAINLNQTIANQNMVRDKIHLKLPNYIDDYDIKDLENNPGVRRVVQHAYHDYQLRNIWGLVCAGDQYCDPEMVRGLHTSNQDLRREQKEHEKNRVNIHSHPDFLYGVALKLEDILEPGFLRRICNR